MNPNLFSESNIPDSFNHEFTKFNTTLVQDISYDEAYESNSSQLLSPPIIKRLACDSDRTHLSEESSLFEIDLKPEIQSFNISTDITNYDNYIYKMGGIDVYLKEISQTNEDKHNENLLKLKKSIEATHELFEKPPFLVPIPSNFNQTRNLGDDRKYTLNHFTNGIDMKSTKTPMLINPYNVKVFGQNHENNFLNLSRPWGITCDKFGNIYVSDRTYHRIMVYDCTGKYVRCFGQPGSLPGQFNRPVGITIDKWERLVIVDKDNHRIQMLDLQGNFIKLFGEKGSRPGQFNYPWDVAINKANGNIAITDSRNHRIQTFDFQGRYLGKFGFVTPQYKFLDSPRGITFGPNSDIYITDFNVHRIIIINSKLEFVRVIGEEGSGPRQLFRPQGIKIDESGHLIVCDSRNNRIKILHEKTYEVLQIIDNANNSFLSCQPFDRPTSICLLPNNISQKIAVVNFGHNSIHIY